MLSEQQQRIMGYFIEEAKDHLNTIEQGLLSLQSTISDPEMAHEVFRAAHSVKGGAAMLGLDSIQQTSHRLEDYFKVLKECPVQVDQRLESLLLNVFDTLRDLLDQLQGPFGLTDDKAQEAMVAIEPTFAQLNEHISHLVTQAGATPPDDVNLQALPTITPPPAVVAVAVEPAEESAFQLIFQSDVPARLREMLQLFKQPESAEVRQQLDEICQSLGQAGEQFELVPWVDLLNLTRRAIAHADNDFRSLAPVLIREIKRAQEQALSNQAMAISASDALLALVPPEAEPEFEDLASFDFLADDVEEMASFDLPDLGLQGDEDSLLEGLEESPINFGFEADIDLGFDSPTPSELEGGTLVQEGAFAELDLGDDFGRDDLTGDDGPVVGAAELNSLADLFEADTPELTMTWQEEEILSDLDAGMPEPLEVATSGDFSDLLQAEPGGAHSVFEEPPSQAPLEAPPASAETGDPFLTDITGLGAEGPGLELFGDAMPAEDQMMGELNLFFSDIQDDSLEEASTVNRDSDEEESIDFLFEDTSEPIVLTDLPGMDDPFGGISISSFGPEEDEEEFPSLSQNPFQDAPGVDLDLAFDMAASAPDLTDAGPFELPDFDLDVVDSLEDESFTLTIPEPEASTNEDPDAGLEFPEMDVQPSPVSEPESEPEEGQAPTSWLDMLDSEDGLIGLTSAPPMWEIEDEDVTADLWDEASTQIAPPAFNTPATAALDEPVLELPETAAGDENLPFESGSDAAVDDWFSDGLDLNLELPADLNDSGLESLDLDLDSLVAAADGSNVSASEQAMESSDADFGFDLGLFDENPEESATASGELENIPADFFQDASDLTSESEGFSLDMGELGFDLDLGEADDESPELGADTTAGDLDSLFDDETPFDFDLDGGFEEPTPLETEATAATDASWDGSSLDLGLDLDFDQPSTTETPDISGDIGNLLDEAGLDFDLNPPEDTSSDMALEDGANDLENLFDESALDLGIDDSIQNMPDLSGDFGEDLGAGLDLGFGDEPLDLSDNAGMGGLFDEQELGAQGFGEQEFDAQGFGEQGFELQGFGAQETEQEAEEDQSLDASAPDEFFSLMTGEADAESGSLTEATFADLSFDEDFVDVSPTLFPEDATTGEADVEDLSLDFEMDDLEMDDLLNEPLLDGEEEAASSFTNAMGGDDFDDLDALLEASFDQGDVDFADAVTDIDQFSDLEALLDEPSDPVADRTSASRAEEDSFADLEALLEENTSTVPDSSVPEDEPISSLPDDEFEDLEKLLEAADTTLGGPPSVRGVRSPAIANRRPTAARASGLRGDQTMRVSVKNLDNLNNLIGELVVNRNSLEQAEERLRQFLDNLQYQVQQLSDVGQRMRDLYERSLLESSLMTSRKSYQMAGIPTNASAAAQSHATGVSFDALEMDRFTGFHTLSQEMIELIVRVRESASDIDFVVGETDQVTRNFRQITSQLQESLTRARMVPFAQTADRLPRAVRDISLRCGKQAELTIEGRETLIDKMILEQLYDPMTHLVNNAITHGIETPDERTSQGKAATGRITVRAFHQGNQTVIAVSDDGAGIDPERVKQKAVERKLITPEQARMMNRLDVYDLLFHHGFSTRDRADDFAGRGVGMDVVRTSLNDIRGVINIDSTVGRGTTFTIRLPLTLSVSKALCCISNRARIAFPMDGVEDMLDVPRDQIQTNAEGQSCIQWRDQLLPFQALADLLKFNRSLGRGSVYGGNQEEDIISVVVLRSNAGSYLALQVDQVLGEQEIVIKQLEGPVPKPVGIAGATVLGDGRIMPIADVLELIDLSMGRIRRESGTSFWDQGADQVPVEPVSEVKTEPTVLIVDDSITVRELLSMTFNKVGYRVEQARDGQEAWEKLRSGLPCDLVFCDIEMPRMDGLELLSRLQKDGQLNRVPIAMLTSRGADRHRQMAIQLGAKGYFTKPYLEEVLLDAAQRMLKGEVLVDVTANDGAV